MKNLTIDQMIWSIRWAADYLADLDESDSAIKVLRDCADSAENRAAIGKAVSEFLDREGVAEADKNYGQAASEIGFIFKQLS
jgi:hypothetical protein